ncbi:MAG: ABC transporter ATP-binding protein [Andreesenia angusta]|nr:ABC transporter ATP-binding protein [Andreesenia angusta]
MFIQTKNLSKYYGQGDNRVQVLKNIECEIERGEICVFLGPSGSGKSTFLNILGGIEVFEEGFVKVNGRELNKLSQSEISEYRREELGFIFQFYNLIPNLTTKENIEVGSYLSENPLIIDEIMKILGLYEHRDKYPNQLSGGQQQRTGIGRAIIKNPSLLICDEPTGALDYNTSKDVLSLIQDINKKYKNTILIATHNIAIANIADKIFKLHDGKIVRVEENKNKISAKDLSW